MLLSASVERFSVFNMGYIIFLCVCICETSLLPICSFVCYIQVVQLSDQQIVIFPANRNRIRFAEPTFIRIGIGIVRESKNLQIGIGIIFVRWEVFANYSRTPEIFFLSYIILIISFS